MDLRYNLWGRKYEVYFYEVYLKSVSHHKIWFLTNFSSNAAHFLSIQAIFTDLTFNLSFKLYLLTSDLNFSVENTKCVCMKFTHWVYFTLKTYFLIKCSLFQVQTRHITDFELWPWHLPLKKIVEKIGGKVLIQNWSRNITSPTINMNFPRKLHKLPNYLVHLSHATY